MTSRSLFCTIASAAIVTTGLATVITPATAVSGTLLYDCTSEDLGSHVVSAVIDTDAPATLLAGQSVPVTVTTTVTIPESMADVVRLAGVTAVDGTAVADGYVNGAIRQANLTIPKTVVPSADDAPIVVTGSGPTAPLGAAIPVVLDLTAGGFTATFNLYNASDTIFDTATMVCTVQPSQIVLVDSVTVNGVPTTTTITVASPLEYGAAPDVTADVAVTGSNAKPAGTVEFTFEGKSVKVGVKGGKAKATLAAALTMGSRTVSAKFTPTDASLAPSEASRAVTVVRAQTTTTATAVYRDARNRLVGKALVEAHHGTDVAGDVKFVLRRNGVKIRTAIVELNQFDKAKKVFKRIRKPGTYRLIARYLGSETLKRSVDRVKLNV